MNGYQVGVIVSAGCFLLGMLALPIVAHRTESERAIRTVGLCMAGATVAFWVCVVLAGMDLVNS